MLFVGGYVGLLFLISLVVTGTVSAESVQSESDSEASAEIMGKVEYELPHELGTLTFAVPKHWVGGRVEGVDAVWIDQNNEKFKKNVTLKVRPFNKISNPDQLLDLYLDKLIESLKVESVSDIHKTPGRRAVSVDRTISGHAITQSLLVVYAESSEKSYLVSLTNSHLRNDVPLDLTEATID